VGLTEIIGGKYRPRDVLGVGATGIVYSVEHTLTGELLALKVMTTSSVGNSADAIERFKREARLASKIRSQHVVRIFDADVAPELDGAPYLVMDLLDGVDLEQVSGDKPVEVATVVEWLRQVAPSLDKAHRLGIIHRDLKPENLFLTQREDGTPLIKILDFGIAKLAAESTGSTKAGQLLGTPLYMAPEQARGDPEQVGPTSDRYALALIAYKLLTGAPYWTATSVAGIIAQILYEPLQAPSERHAFGTEFDAWFLHACNPDPAHRFGSATEQIEALAHALGLPVEVQQRIGASLAPGRDSPIPEARGASAPASAGDRMLTTVSEGPRRNGASLAPHVDTVSPPPISEAPKDMLRARKWPVAAFFIVLATIVVLLLVFMDRAQQPEHVAAKSAARAAEPAALPDPLPAPVAATAAPAGAESAVPSTPAATAEPSKPRAPTVNASTRREPAKTQAARAVPPRASPRRDKWIYDEELSDQK